MKVRRPGRISRRVPLLDKPVFRSSLQVEVIDDREVILLGERDHYVLSGSPFVVLAELLKAPRPVTELLTAAAPRASAIEVFYALERLEMLGVIREAGEALPASVETFWDALGAEPAAAVHRIAAAKVMLAGIGGIATKCMEETLGA